MNPQVSASRHRINVRVIEPSTDLEAQVNESKNSCRWFGLTQPYSRKMTMKAPGHLLVQVADDHRAEELGASVAHLAAERQTTSSAAQLAAPRFAATLMGQPQGVFNIIAEFVPHADIPALAQTCKIFAKRLAEPIRGKRSLEVIYTPAQLNDESLQSRSQAGARQLAEQLARRPALSRLALAELGQGKLLKSDSIARLLTKRAELLDRIHEHKAYEREVNLFLMIEAMVYLFPVIAALDQATSNGSLANTLSALCACAAPGMLAEAPFRRAHGEWPRMAVGLAAATAKAIFTVQDFAGTQAPVLHNLFLAWMLLSASGAMFVYGRTVLKYRGAIDAARALDQAVATTRGTDTRHRLTAGPHGPDQSWPEVPSRSYQCEKAHLHGRGPRPSNGAG